MSGTQLSTDQKVEQAIDVALTLAGERLRRVIAQCESPIESLFLLQFADSAHGIELLEEDGHEYRIFAFGRTEARGPIQMIPQYRVKIDGAEYRIDLVLIDGPIKFAAECDGHQWHERTKEQAARDKSRERALTAAGWTVMRFTGSEIWRDAIKCAGEFANAFIAARERLEAAR